MKADDGNRLEAAVRNANPVPQADALIDSEESAAVTFRLMKATERDVPGLLTVPPQVQRRERGLKAATVQSVPEYESKRPQPVRIAAIAFAAAVFITAVVGAEALINREGADDLALSSSVVPPDITFVDPERELFTHEATIRQLIEDTYAQGAPLLDVEGVSFVVSLEIYRLPVPEYGVGWSTADEDTVVIAIDPYLPRLDEVMPETVPRVVADALYTVARSRGGESEETFFDSMVRSGLADHFVVELLGGPAPLWANAFPAERTEELMERAQPLFDIRWDDERNPDLTTAERHLVGAVYDQWFGSDDRGNEAWREQQGVDIPEWAGFTLGYRLIENYLAENPGQAAADLVNTPASVFRP
jgi:hypothetical protein